MSAEDNKAVVGHWFTEFWGSDHKVENGLITRRSGSTTASPRSSSSGASPGADGGPTSPGAEVSAVIIPALPRADRRPRRHAPHASHRARHNTTIRARAAVAISPVPAGSHHGDDLLDR